MICPFCNRKDTIFENEYAFVVYDKYPVSKGHILVIPRRHFSDYFDCNVGEHNSLFKLIDECKNYLGNKFHPDGYNLGINIGVAAGQTIDHMHIHLIPRYEEDMTDPRGGVRGVIPDKMRY